MDRRAYEYVVDTVAREGVVEHGLFSIAIQDFIFFAMGNLLPY